MGKKSKAQKYKIVIIGAASVGKYSIKEQYMKGWIAPKDFKGPSGSEFKTETIDGKKVEVSIDCFKAVSEIEDLKIYSGVILVYNISDANSVTYLKEKIFPDLKKAEYDSVSSVLVGNKVDEAKLSRAVELADAESHAKEMSCISVFETSATCNVNITNAFRCLNEDILKNTTDDAKPKEESKSSCCTIL